MRRGAAVLAAATALSACASTGPSAEAPWGSDHLAAWTAHGVTLGLTVSFNQMEATGLEYAGVLREVAYWRSSSSRFGAAEIEVQTAFPARAQTLAAGPEGDDAQALVVVSIQTAYRVSPPSCEARADALAAEIAATNPALHAGRDAVAGGWSDQRVLTPVATTIETRRAVRGVQVWCNPERTRVYVQRRFPYDALGDFLPEG